MTVLDPLRVRSRTARRPREISLFLRCHGLFRFNDLAAPNNLTDCGYIDPWAGSAFDLALVA